MNIFFRLTNLSIKKNILIQTIIEWIWKQN